MNLGVKLFLMFLFVSALEASVLNKSEFLQMPAESSLHEGTWLQWPHDHTYRNTVKRYESVWVAVTKALHTGENIHIVSYNAREKIRIYRLLAKEGVNMERIDFRVWQTDSVWIRNNGPLFVYNEKDNLIITDWKYSSQIRKESYIKDNLISKKISRVLKIPRVAAGIVKDGGAVEVDGRGTMIGRLGAILNDNRNAGFNVDDLERQFRKYLGVTNFIWLQGERVPGIRSDHVNGIARFVDSSTIVTLSELYADPEDLRTLMSSKDIMGKPYRLIYVPMTAELIAGTGLRGSYMNYYVGNEAVLVPQYKDPNDKIALNIFRKIYPDRNVVGINCVELLKDGGSLHTIMQQQPMSR